MKTIGLLGGTGWSSTIDYYKLINQLVHQRLGGYHSAKILLKSIDYHEILSAYGKDHDRVAQLLQEELAGLIALKPDCILICCNTLHKYFDKVKANLPSEIPVFHAIDLVAEECAVKVHQKVLLLASQFTLEDGFFAKKLKLAGIDVVIPNQQERDQIQVHHEQLLENIVIDEARKFFKQLIAKYAAVDAVIVGCTEFPMAISQQDSAVPLVDPVQCQVHAAVEFAVKG